MSAGGATDVRAVRTGNAATFLDQGFVVCPAAIPPDDLARLKKSFRAGRVPVETAWREQLQRGELQGNSWRTFDLNDHERPGSFLRDTTWMETLLENPMIDELARQVCGENHQLYEIDARVKQQSPLNIKQNQTNHTQHGMHCS